MYRRHVSSRLSAAKLHVYCCTSGVVGGAVTGHGVATLIAIGGGKALSDRVSEKTLQYTGGSLFLLFAATQLVDLLRGV